MMRSGVRRYEQSNAGTPCPRRNARYGSWAASEAYRKATAKLTPCRPAGSIQRVGWVGGRAHGILVARLLDQRPKLDQLGELLRAPFELLEGVVVPAQRHVEDDVG